MQIWLYMYLILIILIIYFNYVLLENWSNLFFQIGRHPVSSYREETLENFFSTLSIEIFGAEC